MPNLVDLTGKVMGRWTVLRRSGTKHYPSGAYQPLYLCRCNCGTEKEVAASILKSGGSRSCGCLNNDVRKAMCIKRNTTHGAAAEGKTPTYTIWTGMKARCHNPNASGYHKYGARGITVCERWRTSFENFLADMGEKPHPDASLERLNPFKGYAPDNCSWIHVEDQPYNKTNTRLDSFKALRKLIAQFCDAHGVTVEDFAKTLLNP